MHSPGAVTQCVGEIPQFAPELPPHPQAGQGGEKEELAHQTCCVVEEFGLGGVSGGPCGTLSPALLQSILGSPDKILDAAAGGKDLVRNPGRLTLNNHHFIFLVSVTKRLTSGQQSLQTYL